MENQKLKDSTIHWGKDNAEVSSITGSVHVRICSQEEVYGGCKCISIRLSAFAFTMDEVPKRLTRFSPKIESTV